MFCFAITTHSKHNTYGVFKQSSTVSPHLAILFNKMSFFKKIFKSEPIVPASAIAEYDAAAPPERIILSTTHGDLTIQLFPTIAPLTCKNFVLLLTHGKYDDCVVHRLIPGFMLQTGDFTRGDGTGGKSVFDGGRKFQDELDPTGRAQHDRRGILSMANSGPNSNASQFFVTFGPVAHLDGKHTVFGAVTDGQAVLDRLEAVKTGELDRPVPEGSVKILGGKVVG
ncbi:peptidyl-prolyl cis-trans isomerase-like 1 [Phlyctema vagabunda]|uniref:Peptidyl-prolyl cis-trans isomerase n=1 Tax=Phlyctema vagabunda TaxID=108571 RepID=A0ABR4PLC8_9HELO